ncbi:DJ-1/PfpI family protein [Azoarcus sp. KH32C]|uniref:DJ-1/PfpI family protein n=1 Tax=Azoarcus sp. KH32C TaxID=748247 RepID=UPI0002387074|nr:DJ-1/PfpI family protein [Azoarcus sp. KH32C]BAL26664.1 ThiJ/PfpI family protein [Azoarcus sp. KH32C]
MTTSVGIFVFDDVEVLDFAGPYEVFTTASRMHRRGAPAAPELFSVFTIGRTGAPVRARAGLEIHPDHDFVDHPPIDILIVPGGVVTQELEVPAVASWIGATAGRTRLTASVCTGAFLLAQAGLLDGKSATTHWEDVADLREMFPQLDVRIGVRWVDEDAIVTSAGISAGIDMCLHLVERIAGRELAERTARQMDFDWRENS